MSNIRKLRMALLAIVCFLSIASFAKTALAVVPTVNNVVVWSSGADTILNVTVAHADFTSSHYVNQIEVSYGSVTKYFNFTSQTSTTFTAVCNLGPVDDAPTATVRAHCNTHGWSVQNWTGQIPEFSLAFMLLTLAAATSLIYLVHRKNHIKTCS